MTYVISALLGVLAASTLGLTAEQVLNRAYDAANTALRVNVVSGGGITSGTTTITGGADTQVCFNDGGTISCGDSGLVWTKATDILSGPSAVRVGDGSAAAPAYSFGSATNWGLFKTADGIQVAIAGGSGGPLLGSTSVSLGAASNVRWTNSSNPTSGTGDLFLTRRAANILEQRNSTNAQKYCLTETWTDADNREAGCITMGSDTMTIAPETAGTGADNQNIALAATGTGQVRVTAGDFVHTGTSAIGWAMVTGANTACNTTCTNACVAGFANGTVDSTASLIVACTDASADRCLCAGSS